MVQKFRPPAWIYAYPADWIQGFRTIQVVPMVFPQHFSWNNYSSVKRDLSKTTTFRGKIFEKNIYQCQTTKMLGKSKSNILPIGVFHGNSP